MKDLIKKLATISLAIVLAVSLTACGGSKDDAKTTREPVPAYEAFNKEGVWFVFDNEGVIDKEGNITDILVFDGEGNVTAYNVSLGNTFQFSELKDKSTEEIIEMAKQIDKDIFNTEKNYVLTVVASELSEERLSMMQKIEYVAPEAEPIKLHIETDHTGNATQTEFITYNRNLYNFYDCFSADNDTWYVQDRTIELFPDYDTQTVHDMNFRGFTNLTTLIIGEHVGFVRDTPDTKGIEVD